ncbi:hypothetical protein GGH12_005347 [Coemansia sp. RSA 1822]|nr:hypothetical protein LPJ76_005026 [Coemansia sp. RSA 638]KAJ2541496.1 hypothetical protein GGF49_003612 [Coemansia sp. RSA 1853]KAJ2559547.1 hypothetical protein GGH12_005347 [Coemansia sp. RSA 1822]
MWKTSARLITRHAAHSLLHRPCTHFSTIRTRQWTHTVHRRSFWSTQYMCEESIDKERRRQQAQDDVHEEMEEHKRERVEETGEHGDELAPEVERLDPQSIPGLYPEFDDPVCENRDDSWYVDTEFANAEPMPLWQRRAHENLGNHTRSPQELLEGTTLDICCSVLREDGEVSVFDVSGRCDWTAQMVVARATSTRHMRAMGERLIKTIKERSRLLETSRTICVDGRESDDWMVVDMGAFVVHIMTPEAHEMYDLEALWTAPVVEVEDESMWTQDETIRQVEDKSAEDHDETARLAEDDIVEDQDETVRQAEDVEHSDLPETKK